MVVDDEVALGPDELPQLLAPTFEGALLPREVIGVLRRHRLMERYDALDPDFRVVAMGKRPSPTDGMVMLTFAMLGFAGVRRLGAGGAALAQVPDTKR
jgi:hypothetical protein